MISLCTYEECSKRRIFNTLRILAAVICVNVLCMILCVSFVLAKDNKSEPATDDVAIYVFSYEDEEEKNASDERNANEDKKTSNEETVNNDNRVSDENNTSDEDSLSDKKNVSTENEIKSEKNEKSEERSSDEDEIKDDKVAPNIRIDGFDGNKVYADNVSFSLKVTDNIEGINIRYRCVMLTTSGDTVTLEDSTNRSENRIYERAFSYTEEGAYNVMYYAYDDSGNATEIGDISFAIDTSAPVVEMDGFDFSKPSNKGASLTISVKEIFYENMLVEVRVFRNDEGSILEIPVSAYNYKAVSNKNIYTFDGNGTYRVSVTARDSVGHTTEKEVQFVIDSKPPKIDILFDGDYPRDGEILDKIPGLDICVEDTNYSGGIVNVSLYRKKGNNVYEDISIAPTLLNANKTVIPLDVREEGYYELKVSATDGVNNLSSESLSFTIDTTSPLIGYLSEYNEKYLKSFVLPDNLKKYMKDMTEVRYKAYLNSEETGHGEIKKDGKYILQVVAVDEAGNSSEEMVAFIVDNKAPTVVLNGLNENGNLEKNVPVELSLKDDQDVFTSVYVNGEKLNLSSDKKTAKLIPTEYGNYRIYVSARDNAGNVTAETIMTNCENVFAAPLSNCPKEIEVKTLTKIENKSSLKLNNCLLIWGLCGCICAVATILVIIAFSYEMKYTR